MRKTFLFCLLLFLLAMPGFALEKNTASQKWVIFCFDDTDNSAKTGDAAQITANVRIDGAQNAVDDANPTELEDGYYEFGITAAESNGENILICPDSSTANIQCIGCPMALYTRPPAHSDFNDPLTAAETESEANDALVALNLDHLLKTDTTVAADGDLEAYCVAGTIMGHILSTSADVTLYKASTDSLQAIRDRGDSAWPTATSVTVSDKTGFSLSAAGNTAVIDDFETQSQADPTGFHVNVYEIGGTAQTANDNGADINAILTDTGTTLDTLIKDVPTVAEFNARTIASADYVVVGDTLAAVTSAGLSAGAVDDIWDELLTGAAHNTATSAGRRLRQAADVMIIREETCQAGGGNDEVILDAAASAVNDFYIYDLIVLSSGTGAGQQRHIDSYVGATNICTVNRNWTTNPDATTGYVIKADSSKHVHGFLAEAKAEINTEVDGALDTAIPAAPTDGSINAQIKRLSR
ncbi:MAG: hypothetical protein KAV87_30610 [Desulfobacteraceae bacterium]|nr:hypothetical protein [Desulfobacteraceae bacterium]